jgi:hypothetical protein
MSIINPGDHPIDAQTVDGVELAARLNRLYSAINSQHANTTRPSYITAGGVWSRTNAQGVELILFDGTRDIVIGAVANGAGSFGLSGDKIAPTLNPASAYKAGDVVWAPASGKFITAISDMAAGSAVPGNWRDATSALEGLAKPLQTPPTIDFGLVSQTNQPASNHAINYTRIGDVVRAYCTNFMLLVGTPSQRRFAVPVARPSNFSQADDIMGNVWLQTDPTQVKPMAAEIGTKNIIFDWPAPGSGNITVHFDLAYILR